MAAGIETRKGPRGTRYRASVWSEGDGKLIRKTFDSLAAAKRWRVDASQALAQGTLRPPSILTVREAAEEWLDGARDGTSVTARAVGSSPPLVHPERRERDGEP